MQQQGPVLPLALHVAAAQPLHLRLGLHALSAAALLLLLPWPSWLLLPCCWLLCMRLMLQYLLLPHPLHPQAPSPSLHPLQQYTHPHLLLLPLPRTPALPLLLPAQPPPPPAEGR
jgi:hypothetical protein